MMVPVPAEASASLLQPQNGVVVQMTPLGRTTEVNLLQFWKTVPVNVTLLVCELLNFKLVIAVQPLKLLLAKLVKEEERLTVTRAESPEKADPPTLVTVEGKVKLVKEEQAEKLFAPMEAVAFPSVNEAILLQPVKAESLMLVKALGKMSDVSEEQFVKA